MYAENVTLEDLTRIAEALGILLKEQKAKRAGDLKFLIRPAVGSRTFRAMTTTGFAKNSLCLHGHFAFMSAVFAEFPEAILRTFVNTWNLPVFEGGARPWTENELKERSGDTCDCTPEQIEDALRTPSELNAAAGVGA